MLLKETQTTLTLTGTRAVKAILLTSDFIASSRHIISKDKCSMTNHISTSNSGGFVPQTMDWFSLCTVFYCLCDKLPLVLSLLAELLYLLFRIQQTVPGIFLKSAAWDSVFVNRLASHCVVAVFVFINSLRGLCQKTCAS